jgi:ribokinase
VPGFPLHYNPVNYPFFGVHSAVAGVGYNIARALRQLGNDVHLLSIIGQDPLAELVRSALQADRIAGSQVLSLIAQTPQSVVLYDPQGRRQIHVDLKNIQETSYPDAIYERAADACEMMALCNINFSRPFLGKAAAAGKLIATDVHAVASLEDDYNREFMRAAHILFMSDEALPAPPEEFARAVMGRYAPKVLVIGLGAQGALLCVRKDNYTGRFPAVATRPVVNTIGAGDALFSAFLHFYLKTPDPYESLRRAVVFAGHKTGAASAAEGFACGAELESLYAQHRQRFQGTPGIEIQTH